MYKPNFKGILKLILVIFCISWKLAIGSINDIYETLTRFLSMKLCKWHNSLIILSYLAVFPIIEFLLPGQKFIFDPIKWYFNDIRDYMGVQSIFGLFLQLYWKETTFVKTSFNIPLKGLDCLYKFVTGATLLQLASSQRSNLLSQSSTSLAQPIKAGFISSPLPVPQHVIQNFNHC